ncbi:two-component sensor histidine kinase, partial [Pseudomonas sp. PA-6-3F]|nr:two-component sensor histidine kinase [Pseudomonas sp. PA-6-3F]
MRATFNTLFGRLFGVLLVAIVLAHVLAIFWFRHYGPPPPRPQETFVEQPDGTMKPLARHHR